MTRAVSESDLVQLAALADGELGAADAAELERRLASAADLSATFAAIAAGREAARSLERPELPEGLRLKIEALAGKERVGSQPDSVRGTGRRASSWRSGWQTIAASMLVGAVLASGATSLFVARREVPAERAIADGHRRSLLSGSPVDIASSDRHTVKPWLDARLGLSPPAPDLAASGYPLVGGRVDVLGGAAVPVLVYRHNEHLVTVMAIPAAGADTAPRGFAADGYNWVRWRSSGFAFAALSDLEPGELAALVADYLAATGGG